MKAWMSDRDAREHSGGYGWREALGELTPLEWRLANAEHSRAALQEAWAILAETEPMRPGYRMADRCYLGPVVTWMDGYPLALPGDAGAALAEALTAFVNQ